MSNCQRVGHLPPRSSPSLSTRCVVSLIGAFGVGLRERIAVIYFCCESCFFFFARSSVCEICYKSVCAGVKPHMPRLPHYERDFSRFFLFFVSSMACMRSCLFAARVRPPRTSPPSSDVCLLSLCACACVRVFIIQGHSAAPHGSVPYPGRHGNGAHLSQRVPADQTGVHPYDVSARRLLLGTFVARCTQVLVAAGGNQRERQNIVLMSQSELVCVCVFCAFS